MWCNECKEEHTPQEFCSSCGTCLVGQHSYPHDDKDQYIRLVMCLVCYAFNTIEYDIIEYDPEHGPLTVQDLEKTFDEHWGSEGEADEGLGDNIIDIENSHRNL